MREFPNIPFSCLTLLSFSSYYLLKRHCTQYSRKDTKQCVNIEYYEIKESALEWFTNNGVGVQCLIHTVGCII